MMNCFVLFWYSIYTIFKYYIQIVWKMTLHNQIGEGGGNKYILMRRLLSMWHHRFVFSSSMYAGDIRTNLAHKIIKKICDIHKVLNYTKPLFMIFNTKMSRCSHCTFLTKRVDLFWSENIYSKISWYSCYTYCMEEKSTHCSLRVMIHFDLKVLGQFSVWNYK